jgi:hypothetical protein
LRHLETRCRLECCGVDACELSPLLIEQWASSAGAAKIREAIEQSDSISKLCDESSALLSCETLSYAEVAGSDALNEASKARRDGLRAFFSKLSAALESEKGDIR